jgi:hypothetical protein
MAVKKPAKMTKAAKKFKGARIEKKRGAKERPQRGGKALRPPFQGAGAAATGTSIEPDCAALAPPGCSG